MLNLWPSPLGKGLQASFLKKFFVEKLLKVTPSVPTIPIAPGGRPP